MLAQSVCTNYALQRSWSAHLPAWSIGWLCVGTMSFFYALQFLFRPHRLLGLLGSLVVNQKHTYLQGFILRKLRGGERRVGALAGSAGTCIGFWALPAQEGLAWRRWHGRRG